MAASFPRSSGDSSRSIAAMASVMPSSPISDALGQELGQAVSAVALSPLSMGVTTRNLRLCRLRTKKGRETYAKRKGIVEPVLGHMKFGRGLRQFLLRGLEKVALEWDLWCIGHNLLKLWRSGWRPGTVQR